MDRTEWAHLILSTLVGLMTLPVLVAEYWVFKRLWKEMPHRAISFTIGAAFTVAIIVAAVVYNWPTLKR